MSTEAGRTPDVASYREKLRTPWWWYPAALAIAAILAAEFHVADTTLPNLIPFAVLLPLAAAIVWWIGRSELSVEHGELRIREAHVPISIISGVVSLDAVTLRRVVGREGDPEAFVSIRPWIGPGLQLLIDDVEDPTPYWVISTRRPQQLIEALRQLS